MNGKEVKEKLLNSGYKLKEIAELMGESPQSLQSLLNAKDIKTGTLERIAESIKRSVYFFYKEPVSEFVIPNRPLEDENKVEQLEKHIKTLENTIKDKEEIIQMKNEKIAYLESIIESLGSINKQTG